MFSYSAYGSACGEGVHRVWEFQNYWEGEAWSCLEEMFVTFGHLQPTASQPENLVRIKGRVQGLGFRVSVLGFPRTFLHNDPVSRAG